MDAHVAAKAVRSHGSDAGHHGSARSPAARGRAAEARLGDARRLRPMAPGQRSVPEGAQGSFLSAESTRVPVAVPKQRSFATFGRQGTVGARQDLGPSVPEEPASAASPPRPASEARRPASPEGGQEEEEDDDDDVDVEDLTFLHVTELRLLLEDRGVRPPPGAAAYQLIELLKPVLARKPPSPASVSAWHVTDFGQCSNFSLLTSSAQR